MLKTTIYLKLKPTGSSEKNKTTKLSRPGFFLIKRNLIESESVYFLILIKEYINLPFSLRKAED